MGKEGKGVFIAPANRLPHRPEYLHMSKEDVQKAEAKRRVDDSKVKAYREELKKPTEPVVEEEAPKSATAKKAKKEDK